MPETCQSASGPISDHSVSRYARLGGAVPFAYVVAMPADPYNLDRFVEAQSEAYAAALQEILRGAKRSHWMWFIFPQLAGLSKSPTAQLYAPPSLDETRLSRPFNTWRPFALYVGIDSRP